MVAQYPWREEGALAPSITQTLAPTKPLTPEDWAKAKAGVGVAPPLTPEPPPGVQESKLKDIGDAFYSGLAGMWHGTKQYLFTELPQTLLGQAREIAKGTTIPIVPGLGIPTPWAKEKELPAVVDTWTQGVMENLQQNYVKREEGYKDWVQSHPELQPREEWAGGVIETVKKNPRILVDPAYIAYIAAESAAFTLAFLGTTLATTAITKNPYLGLMAGVAVTTPAQSHDLYQDLIQSGATHEQAAQLSVPIGAIISSVEIVGGMPVLKAVAPQFFRAFRRNAQREIGRLTLRQLTKKGLVTFGKIEISEALEEVTQQAIQNATVKTIDENRGLLAGIDETVIRTLIATLPLAVIGGGQHTRNLYSQMSAGQKASVDESRAKFESAGIPSEQAELLAVNEFQDTVEGQQVVETTTAGVAPTTIPEVTITAAVTGQPFTTTVYRGTQTGVAPTDEGLVGKAEYWSTDPEYAATYGTVTQSTVELNNPLVINTQSEWDAFAMRTRELRDTAVAEGKSEDWVQATLREQLEKEGHDGVVVGEGIVERGMQVAVFHPETATTREFVPTTAMAGGEAFTGEPVPPVETEALSIPEKLPTTPPPTTPVGELLGRGDNEWEGFMANLQDAQTVADIYSRNDAFRRLADSLPSIRGLFRTFNPSVVADTSTKQSVIVRAVLRDEGQQKTQGVMASLGELGSQESVFGKTTSEGFIESGPLKGQALGDIAQHRAKWESKLTDEQKFWLDRADTIEKSIVKFLEDNEIQVNLLRLEEGGQFATRRVWAKTLDDGTVIDVGSVGVGLGRPGAKLPTEKHRVFKTEAEAIEAGFRYVPYEEALYMKVLGAYNRVADKQSADWLLTQVPWRTTGAPEELILAAEGANLKKRHSQMLLAALNRAVRGERVPDVTIGAIAASYPDQAKALKDLIPRIQANEPTASEVQRLTKVAKGLIDTDTMLSLKAVNARARARESAMRVKVGEAIIPAPAFAGKILTGPEAQETARVLKESFDPSFSKTLGEVNKANAVARYFMLAGDFSPFSIQLIFLMGENPKIYGRAFGGAVRALLDPKFQVKFLAKHKATIDRHPNLLLSAGGATEFTEAMARGGWLSGKTNFHPDAEAYWKSLGLFLPRAIGKVGATVLTPFQRVFESSLDIAGIYMAEAYEHMAKTPADIADIDQFINEFRGLTSSARIGVSGLQRQRETAVILAPRYNRAIAGLLFDLGRGNIRGHLARKALIKGIAAISAIAVAISIARGEDEEEILDHFNPSSSNFFTWDIAGQKVGPGSKIRSLLKLIAQSAGDPEDLLKFSMDNPALRFLRGNLSPVVSSSIDLITGRSYIGDPTRDGLLSFSKEILAGNLLPIWVQSTLLEGGDPGGRSVRGLAEFFGWRAYPEPLWNEVGKLRDKYAMQDYDAKYQDLNRAQIDSLINNHPDLKDLEERAELEGVMRGSEFDQWIYNEIKRTITDRNDSLEEAATLVLDGTISKYDYDKERGYARPYYSGAMGVIYSARDTLDPDAVKDIRSWLSDNQKPEDKALDEYQRHRALLIEKADLPRDWDAIEKQCATFLAKYPKATREYVLANLNRWINDLPKNAKQIELMRLRGIEDETWWDDYRGIPEETEGFPWRETEEPTTPQETKKEPVYPWRG